MSRNCVPQTKSSAQEINWNVQRSNIKQSLLITETGDAFDYASTRMGEASARLLVKITDIG